LRRFNVEFSSLEVGLIEGCVCGDCPFIGLEFDEADAEWDATSVFAEWDFNVEDLTILLANIGQLFFGNLV